MGICLNGLRITQDFLIGFFNTKVNNLLKYDMPDYIYDTLKLAKQKIDDFDDGAAEEMIKNLLDEMRNPQKQYK